MLLYWKIRVSGVYMVFSFGVRIGQPASHPPARPLALPFSLQLPLPVRFNVAYGVGKAGVDRLVKDMAVGKAQIKASSQITIKITI